MPATDHHFTRLSKVLAVVLLGLFVVINVAPSSREYLSLVPGRTLPFVWNLVTGAFVCRNVLEALFSILSLLLLARVVEPIYGSTEFLKLILVTAFSSGLATFCVSYLVFLTAPFDRKGKTLYTEFSGFHGIIAGMLVAVKQIMPDHEVILAGLFKLKASVFPSVYVLLCTAVIAVTQSWPCLAFLYFSTYTSWLYLRFLQQQPETSVKGDPSDEFKFSSFFPEALEAPIDAVAGVMGRVLGFRHDPNAQGRSLLPTTSTVLGSNSADANRRRERGAKALEERLEMKKIAQAPAIQSAAAVEAASVLPGSGSRSQLS